MKVRIGVDVGGTNIVCGVVSPGGLLIQKIKQPTETARGSEYVLGKIAGIIRQAVELAGLTMEDVECVGVGTPGLVDPSSGVTVFAGNLGWHNVPVADILSRHLNLPVKVDNDVRMYVLGEAVRGAGRGYKHVLGITVGTGLAAAFVEDGRLFYGSRSMAGELGHICFNEIPYVCSCGLTGCLETVASATGLVRQALTRLQDGADSSLRGLLRADGSPSEGLTAAAIAEAYDAGDSLAIEIMNNTGVLLGKGLAYAITLFSPDCVVIGGGVAAAGERLLQPMKEQIRRSVLPQYDINTAIVTAELPDDAGVIGSSIYASSRLN
ncbi:ROK family protein [Paenibacillus beijingensis]|uniref:ROK family transcriptional regulator n=1 Tax=Paenibacillus beijingensis TaxID=1126833 RepID=A0A0D5NKX8_9BACL|nr:ROK family protein [Paenibacillus beijingensis]AJY75637.1 ROK family transcriptional regulator [Paenibacillus beijingensis]